MKLLRSYMDLSLCEASDDSAYSDDVMKSLRAEINKGAKDTEETWVNALELVHKAFSLSNIERPDPDLKSAWTQYETLITYAVQQLSKSRGIDGSWRMSDRLIKEESELLEFRVILTVPNHPDTCSIIKDVSIDRVVNTLDDQIGSDYAFELVHVISENHKYRVVLNGPIPCKTNNYITIVPI